MEHRPPEIAAQHAQASLAVLAERSPTAHGQVRARLRPEVLEHPSCLASIGGALEAFLDVRQVEGRVEVEPRPGGAHFELRWRRRERQAGRP